MVETKLGMSNFDCSIDEGFSDALKSEPGELFGRHAGWNFNGKVYFTNDRFYEEVWVYGSLKETISSDSLEELMQIVNAKYGAN